MIESDQRKLCELHADMKWVKRTLGNHLMHHEKYEIALIIGILLLILERWVF
jgi:hypothetical protein